MNGTKINFEDDFYHDKLSQTEMNTKNDKDYERKKTLKIKKKLDYNK